jgi:hypothetical protein
MQFLDVPDLSECQFVLELQAASIVVRANEKMLISRRVKEGNRIN